MSKLENRGSCFDLRTYGSAGDVGIWHFLGIATSVLQTKLTNFFVTELRDGEDRFILLCCNVIITLASNSLQQKKPNLQWSTPSRSNSTMY